MNRIVLFSLLVLTGLLSCKKEEPVLKGNASTAGFTFEVQRMPGGDTLPFINTVKFTNTSADAFSYLWDFGDASTSVLANPVHVFPAGTNFNVKLTSVGKAGYNISTQAINLSSPCQDEGFNHLTGCGNRKWSVSPDAHAINVISPTGDTIFSGAGANCLIDDQYTFNIAGSLSYDSKGETFLANEGPTPYSCQATQNNASKFYYIKGNPSRLVLAQDSGERTPFLGTTDPVQGFSYEILMITEDEMEIRGLLADGNRIQVKFINASLSINLIRYYLTNGSRKTWKLDASAGAKPIVAGTEANPTLYYPGGALQPCQSNDWYTFTASDSLEVNFNGDAMIYGGPGDYNCGPYQNYGGTFALGPVQGAASGAAQIVLSNSDQFIGVMDRVQNFYRILEIGPNKLVLRIGDGTSTVQTLKFVPK